MNRNPYEILNVPENASDDAVKDAYRALARQYHPDRFAPDDPNRADAEARMREINDAYDEIVRRRSAAGGFNGSPFSGVRACLARGDFSEAERELDLCPPDTRSAEWHFLKSVCLDRRGQSGDAMQELNTACSMDPGNEEYAKSREIYRARAGGYGASYQTDTYGNRRTDSASFCNCCTNLIVADCCCECLGGDLIPCI